MDAMTGMQGAGEALSALSLWGAFLLGLAAGFTHCLTMCGPLVTAVSLTDGRSVAARASGSSDGADVGGAPTCDSRSLSRRAIGFQFSYHVGRLLTYAAIGALLGLAGLHGVLRGLAGPLGSQSVAVALRVVAGLMIVGAGIWLLVAPRLGASGRLPEPTRWLASRPWFASASRRFARGRWGLPLGMLMGLLPCMPLLPAEAAALAAGSAPGGVAVMLAFGLGTVPALAGAGAASGLLGARGRAALAPVVGVLVVALGLVVVAQAAYLAAFPM